jgi:putative OPT family oligopeptide transporter
MWNMVPPYLQVVVLSYLGAVLGLAAMVPLRRLLIVQSHDELPYPEGTACAEVLRATVGGSSASAWIFRGMALGAAIKIALSIAFLTPSNVYALLPILPKAELALELAPALLGVGFILGYRQSGVLVAGSLLSAIVLTPLVALTGAALVAPLAPEPTKLIADMSANEIWSRYVRYVGAGAVAAGGIITVLRALPTMTGAFMAVARGVRRSGMHAATEAPPNTDRDLPASFVVGAIIFVVAVAAIVPGVFAGTWDRYSARCAQRRCGLWYSLRRRRRTHRRHRQRVVPADLGVALITLLGVASVFAAAGWTTRAAAVLTVRRSWRLRPRRPATSRRI